MPKIKYAIFDVGQTIYPFTLQPLHQLMEHLTSNKTFYYDNHMAHRYNYNAYMKGLLSNQEFAKELCTFCDVPYTDCILVEINKALHKGCGTPFPETTQAMQQLKINNIELGILSNALPILADTKINIVKPEYTFTSYSLEQLKPDLEIYQNLANRLNCDYNEILFIDDKKQNIEAAQKLGINGIIFQRNTILKEITPYTPLTLYCSKTNRTL